MDNKKLFVRSYIPRKQEDKKEKNKMKKVLDKVGKAMKFIFISILKIYYNIESTDKYARMTPLEVIVGIMVIIVVIIPVCSIIAVLWEYAPFISHCLYAGGLGMDSKWHSYKGKFNSHKFWFDVRSCWDSRYWYDWDDSEAWRLVDKQYNYFKKYYSKTEFDGYGIASAASKSCIGDIMYLDPDGNKKPNHATIITKIADGMIYYTAHTENRKNASILKKYFQNYGMNAKAYILHLS